MNLIAQAEEEEKVKDISPEEEHPESLESGNTDSSNPAEEITNLRKGKQSEVNVVHAEA
jgi:hypothetical protein